jgi:aminocarboxymuconate-semialdehyde decarboxylase
MTCCAISHAMAALPQEGTGAGTLSKLRAFFGHGGGGAAAMTPGRAIDVHAHFFPQSFLKAMAEGGPPPHFPLDMKNPNAPTVVRGSFRLTLDPTYWDVDARVKRMDATGVTVQALSLTAPMVHWAPPERGAALARLYNDAVDEAHTAYPGRFVGCAALPLQDPALALAELNRVAGRKSIRGVYFPTNTGTGELSAKDLFPIYERCEALGLPVMLHPVGVIGAQRLEPFYLGNLLGNPFESAIAAAHFVFGGVLDRFPRLEIILPHGGGAVSALWGRLTHGQGVRPETQGVAKRPFAEYLRRFHYDTITHSPEILRDWIGKVGADRIMLGSDYCFDMGYERPRDIVGKLGLNATDRAKILSGNAARLLKL